MSNLIFSVRPDNVGWSPPSNYAKVQMQNDTGGFSSGSWQLIDGQLSIGASSGGWLTSLSNDPNYAGYLNLTFFDMTPDDARAQNTIANVVMRLWRVDPQFLTKYTQVAFYGPGQWGPWSPPRGTFSTDGLTWVSAPGQADITYKDDYITPDDGSDDD